MATIDTGADPKHSFRAADLAISGDIEDVDTVGRGIANLLTSLGYLYAIEGDKRTIIPASAVVSVTVEPYEGPGVYFASA
ncbi:hypothetical protein SAMN05892883_2083 [Jatrophihabitans sp. GAS493]|nr:hypothetical protein SAMN05892883_2083 [Jatrophihabitans sp. GAS493]